MPNQKSVNTYNSDQLKGKNMKKYLTTLLFTVMVASLMTGVQAQYYCNDHSSSSAVKVIKGTVVDVNHDGSWDFVTFGLQGKNFQVADIEIQNELGSTIAHVDATSQFSMPGFAWYFVSLRELKVPKDFLVKIHLVDGKGFSDDGSSARLSLFGRAMASDPNDPEETVVVVKYP